MNERTYSELEASLDAAIDAEAKALHHRANGHWQDANLFADMRDDHFRRALELDGG